jgi:hypothetical protein
MNDNLYGFGCPELDQNCKFWVGHLKSSFYKVSFFA